MMDLNAVVCLSEYLNMCTPTVIVNGVPKTPEPYKSENKIKMRFTSKTPLERDSAKTIPQQCPTTFEANIPKEKPPLLQNRHTEPPTNN